VGLIGEIRNSCKIMDGKHCGKRLIGR
jgi:hypothetical protein